MFTKSKSITCFVAFAIVALAMSVTTADAFIPYGVHNDVPLDTVLNDWGWTSVYRGNYDDYEQLDSWLLDLIDDYDYVMLAGMNRYFDTIDVLAAGLVTDVFTYTSLNTTNVANGVGWYYNASSMGFAGPDDTINQITADINGPAERDRLSWHTSTTWEYSGSDHTQEPSYILPGWRSGTNVWLNDATHWNRMIFVYTGEPVGPIAYWSFDDPCDPGYDDSGNGHNGILHGATSSEGICGSVCGNVLSFDGDDYVEVADNDIWAFGLNDFSIELWANWDQPGGGSIGRPGDVFIGNDEGSGMQNKWFFALGGGVLNFHINGPATGPLFFPQVPFSPVPGRWYHLAVTREGHLFTIYVDGQPAGSAIESRAIPNANAPLTIGMAENLGWMNGLLDEITVYDRALSASEIEELALECEPENTAPVAVCQDVLLFADENCEGTLTIEDIDGGSYDPDCDPNGENLTITISPAGPFPFVQGGPDTVVTLTVTDDYGLSDQCQALVTVVDGTQPVISCPADVTLECPADISVEATGSATASDNCGSVSIAYSDVAALGCGNTEVITRTWTATDGSGNISSCVQRITVVDNTLPVITCPADVTLECPADTSVAATGSATASDNCGSVAIAYSDVAAAGCGNTEVIARTWTATDECGNSSSCVQTIIVVDSTLPVITCPADVTLECPADTSVEATGSATASDNCSNVAITYSDVSSVSSCNTEIITRTWTATDECGNSTSCVQRITVVDTTDPVITCPADVTLEYPADTSVAATGSATTSDNCGSVAIAYSDVSAAGCGNTEIITRTWTATDDCGNSSSCVQRIIVVDTTTPAITCPADVVLECPADTSVAATGSATGSDAGGNVAIAHSDVSTAGCGNSETITRTWTATDDCGNSSSCVQRITVVDTTPPTITCPADVVLECPADTSVEANGSATATDSCDDSVQISFADAVPPEPSPEKIIIRTWTATDECGNSSSCEQTIEVVDTLPPEVTIGDMTEMWPPNHKYRQFSLSDLGIIVEDECSGEMDIDAVGMIVSIYSDEPEDVKGNGDGRTTEDMRILGDVSFELRSERQGKGNGRVYGIIFEVTDDAGNVTTSTAIIGVPHDQNGDAAVDDGPGAGYSIP